MPALKKMLLKNINLSLRYYIVLSSLLLLLYYGELKDEKIRAILAFLSVFFFYCVVSQLAAHNGAIIANLSKKIKNNNVPFVVGDVVTVLHCLERKMLLVSNFYCLHLC